MDHQKRNMPIPAEAATTQGQQLGRHLVGLAIQATRHLPHEDYEADEVDDGDQTPQDNT